MRLEVDRVGPYVRALAASLQALAPNEDHTPLGAALQHLEALDPVMSGTLLLPADVSQRSGMPAFAWMERTLSEAVLARRSSAHNDRSDADLQRARALDPDLGVRMSDRRALHRHLRTADLLPPTRLVGAVRRLGKHADIAVAYDRMAPDGRWLRVRFEVRLEASDRRGGPLIVDDRGRLTVHDSLKHLLTRHFATPLLAMRTQLMDAVQAEVVRLSRGWVGPFWFRVSTSPTTYPRRWVRDCCSTPHPRSSPST